jgi:hypothetical protein
VRTIHSCKRAALFSSRKIRQDVFENLQPNDLNSFESFQGSPAANGRALSEAINAGTKFDPGLFRNAFCLFMILL